MVLLLVLCRLSFFLPLSTIPFFVLYFVINTFYSIGARNDPGMNGLLVFTGIIIRLFVGIELVDAPNEAVWLIMPVGFLVLTLAVGQRLVKLKGKVAIADK
jgi:hypothetical protein